MVSLSSVHRQIFVNYDRTSCLSFISCVVTLLSPDINRHAGGADPESLLH